MTDLQNLPNIVESILFGAGRPMRLSEMKTLMGSQNIEVDLTSIKVALNTLEERYADSSIEIKEVASGFRMQIRESYGDCLYPLWNDASSRLSKALMETISIIAYKQPVTRGDIEDIRGVTVSTQIIRSLLDREWVKVAGYRDVPGRPALYETTKNFLNDLNLKSINDLPPLPEALPADEALDQLEARLNACFDCRSFWLKLAWVQGVHVSN
jgi:segregation and condensation protein B